MQTTSQIKLTAFTSHSTLAKAHQPANTASTAGHIETPAIDARLDASVRPSYSFGAISIFPPDPPIQPKRALGSVQRLSAFSPMGQGRVNPAPVIPAGWALPPRVQAKLTVGLPNDSYEQEADRVADQVMRMPEPRSVTSPVTHPFTPHSVQRVCAKCEKELQRQPMEGEEKEEETLQTKPLVEQITPLVQRQDNVSEAEQKKEAERLQAKTASGEPPTISANLQAQITALQGGGQPLLQSERAFFEPRFGVDFSKVRVHSDSGATETARAINAKAFTLGQNVVFGAGQYAPGTVEGQRLLAHELTHVVQQGSHEAQPQTLRRTSHGPSTPTNCHNWTIPLPPWLAGTAAHGQISSTLGILPHLIPRATKAGGLLTGIPNPPAITPPGFADLWQRGIGVEVAEIKSTATGSTVAANEARHYRLRHNEWLARTASGTGDARDAGYFAAVGGLLPGGLLDLSAITGADLVLGPFVADLAKMLHIEADSGGAIVYWCTGGGMIGSPLWLPILMKALEELKKMLEDAKRVVQEAAEKVAEAIARFGRALPGLLRLLFYLLLILAFIALMVVAIVCLLGIPVTIGGSSVCTAAAVTGAATAAAALLLMIGLPTTGLPGATASLFRSLQPSVTQTEPESGADYERDADANPGTITSPAAASAAVAAYNPGDEFLNALSPLANALSDPMALARSVLSSVRSLPENGVAQLNGAVAALENMGDTVTSAFMRSAIQNSALDRPGALAEAGTGSLNEAFALLEPSAQSRKAGSARSTMSSNEGQVNV